MKKNLFWVAVMAMGLVACDNEVVSPNGGANADGDIAMLSVSLKAAGDMTKATVGNHQSGTAEENSVKNATFYFFDANGLCYNVTDNSNMIPVNMTALDWENGTGNSIEKLSGIILALKNNRTAPPAKMVALLNVANPALYAGKTLTDLQGLTTEIQNEMGFVMSNSVYEDGTNGTIVATNISPENLFTSPDPDVEAGNVYEAPEGTTVKPVQIYVERVAAKVQVTPDITGSITVTIDSKEEKIYPVTGPGIENTYVRILGWDVTNATNTSYLLKKYAQTDLFTGYNNAALHRSYWATTYNQNPEHGFTFNGLTDSEARYYHENTLTPTNTEKWFNSNTQEGATNAPQLIVAAQLVDADGSPKEFAKWYGVDYPSGSNLQAAMINNAAKQIFVEGGSTPDNKVYNGINTKDVTFYQVPTEGHDYNPNGWTGDRRYEVRVKATTGTKYYNAAGDEMSEDDVNTILNAIEPAMIWASGKTYYYTLIDHFGDADGMVRNHVYDIKIKSFKGLGTPVYEPTEKIIPETPVDQDDYHMTAQINVLQWAIVSQDVNLGQ